MYQQSRFKMIALCPLLFALAIEPLSIMLKSSQSIQGIDRMGMEHKVSLYADDLLLYISNPVENVPKIVQKLSIFGSFSGYKLNLSKSECFPINPLALQIKAASLPIHISQFGFKYLGVHITRTFSGLYAKKILPLISNIKSDLQRWDALHLSLAGRVNCIKMNILPRFLYLFQSLPVFLPKTFFRSINKPILSFLWGGKNPRIRKELLQRQRPQGGLALPNFIGYYWAANLQKIICWYNSHEVDWCKAEANTCISTSLSALITMKLPFSPSKYSSII